MLSVFCFLFLFFRVWLNLITSYGHRYLGSQKFVDTNPLPPNVKIYFFYAHAVLIKNFCSPGLRKSAANLNLSLVIGLQLDVVPSLTKGERKRDIEGGAAALLVLTILTLGRQCRFVKDF